MLILRTPSLCLLMTIRAEETKVLKPIIISDTVDVIEVQG
jgi:hypothetical protein